MKLRFKQDDKIIKKEEYIIPLSVIMYLNETYEDRDISYAILHYFLCYLNEERNISLLDSYRIDSNEIKIELNGLSNKDIPYNEQLNDNLVENFCSFIKDKEINLNILVENIEELPENIQSVKVYDQFCHKLLQEELKRLDDEQIIDLDIEDDEEKIDQKLEETSEETSEEISIKNLFSKYFNEEERAVINETKVVETSPEYEWNQTSLRFKNPNGTWGKWVDLKGASGKSGGGSKGMNREQVNELITYALDPLSGSNLKSHIMSSSYFSMSSGSIANLSATTITVANLIVQNSNVTGTGGNGPGGGGNVSASIVQAHNLSASYFEFISGNVQTLTGTTSITSPRAVFTDLVVTNTNITATIPDPLSSSVQRAHNLSASYFEFISGNVQTLTGTTSITTPRLVVTDLVVINSNITSSGGSRIFEIQVTDPNGAALITGDGQAYLTIPSEMNGNNLINAHASAVTGSSSGTPTIQIRNVTSAVDMLTTKITIDVGDNPPTSYTAAIPPVIDIENDDVVTGELIAVDVDVKGTGVKGLSVILTFAAP